MRDEEQSQVKLSAERVEDRHDLRLGRHIESGRRLVGQKQPRARQERGGDHHPLQKTPGELVRILPEPPPAVFDADVG